MKYKFNITGLDCPNCAAKLASLMSANESIENAKINFLTEKLTVESELEEVKLIALLNEIAKKFEKGVKVEK